MMNNSDIDSLILKVLEGEATPDEALYLSGWIEENEEHELRFEELKKAWNLTSGPIPSSDREEQELQRYLTFIRTKQIKHTILKTGLKYAAVLILPLLLGTYWFMKEGMKKEDVIIAKAEKKITPGSYKAILTTAEGKSIPLYPTPQQCIHVDDNVVVTNGETGIEYRDTLNHVLSEQYNILKTPRGGEYTITLSDGTKVYLNAGSELRYPVVFSKESREVYLSGEAFFEVTKDTNRAFYVTTDAIQIKVYGTTFNVNTYKTEGTQTVLVTGKVGIRGRDAGKEYLLKPSQLALFNNGGDFQEIKTVNPYSYIAWKNGKFIFEDESLEEILDNLSRWYNVEVFFSNESVKNYHFTGHMEKYEDIDIILNAISKMVGVKFVIKGNTITVMN